LEARFESCSILSFPSVKLLKICQQFFVGLYALSIWNEIADLLV
jgi:hypothetical protein